MRSTASDDDNIVILHRIPLTLSQSSARLLRYVFYNFGRAERAYNKERSRAEEEEEKIRKKIKRNHPKVGK